MKKILSIDIGGTEIKYGIVTDDIIEEVEMIKTESNIPEFSVLNKVFKIIDDVKIKTDIDGVAISTAGMVNATEGIITFANSNLPNYTGTELKREIETKYHVPCSVENDVNCAALAEMHDQSLEDFLMITVGTGIGGTLVLNGSIYKGSIGDAGEIGYSIVDGNDLESLASTTAMLEYVRNRGVKIGNGKELFNEAKKGNKACLEAIHRMCKYLAITSFNSMILLGIDTVVLGGGVMEQVDFLNPLIKEYLEEYLSRIEMKRADIRFAKRGNKAGMIGAYLHFKKQFEKQKTILDIIKGELVVSCQALDDEPLHSSYIMGKMAQAAKESGAVAIRAQSVEDINEIKLRTRLPVIGIIKRTYPDSDVFITATRKEVEELLTTDCEMIALDATKRKRPFDEKTEDLVNIIHRNGRLAMADCSTFEECIEAEKIGFDCVSTTLCGYTDYSERNDGPNFTLTASLLKVLKIPLIAEGKINTPEDLRDVYQLGVHSAVVGSAITRPQEITKRFMTAIK